MLPLLWLWLFWAESVSEKPKEAELRAKAPQLASVFPQGARPDDGVEVEVLGQYLDGVSEVVFADRGVAGRVLSGTHGTMRLAFSVAKDADFGPHYFRVISRRGASNVLLFRVGDLPHLREQEPNTSFEEAQRVPVPVTIQGQLDRDGDSDFFRFHAEKGQTLVFDVRAARNGSGLDAGLFLLDPRGRRLEEDEDHFIWDPFFAHTFRETGEFTVVIQPTHTHNDPTFAYQLDIRTAPHIESVNPIAVAPGTEVDATLYGAGFTEANMPLWFDAAGFSGTVTEASEDRARARIRVPSDAVAGVRQVVVVTPAGRSNAGQLVVDPTPAHRGGQAIVPPASVTGVIRYREAERFSFEAKAGEKLLFEVRAMRLGAQVDATLRIVDEAGKQVAYNDDGAFAGVAFNKDPQLVHRFEKAGRYTVEVRNLWKVVGENHPYQLVVRAPSPEAEVMTANETVAVRPNGSTVLKVTAVRKEGHEGAIPVTVEGLPEGLSASALEIPAGKNEGEITFRAGAVAVGTHGPFRVMAGGRPGWRAVRIASGGGEGATFGTVREGMVVVTEAAHYSLEAAATSVNLVRGGTASVVVTIKRADGFVEPVAFSFENLPEGVTAEETVSAVGAGEASLVLRARPDTKAGRVARFLILGKAASGEVQEAAKIALVVD